MPLSVVGDMSRASDSAAQYGAAPQNTVFNSQEQIFSPIAIRKGAAAAQAIPGFENPQGGNRESGPFGSISAVGPTRSELDPYFSNILGDDGSNWIKNCDYLLMVNDGVATVGGKGGEINIRKTDRDISNVTAVALRGPLMLSGWGYDIADKPVPALAQAGDDSFEFDDNVVGDRGTWKTGPVNLQWDAERAVWQGGPQILCGVTTGGIKAPASPCSPTSFAVKVFRRTTNAVGGANKLDACILGETISCTNRDPSLTLESYTGMTFVVAVRINYEWIPIWVGCPDNPFDVNDLQNVPGCSNC